MAKWKVKCIGCKEILNLECKHCGHEDLKEVKRNDSLWLECSNCDSPPISHYHHGCKLKSGRKGGTDTDFEFNRDHFYKLNRTIGSSLLRFLLYVVIFVGVVYLLFPSFIQIINTRETWLIPGLILLILFFFVYKYFDHIRYEYRYRPVRRFFGFLFAILLSLLPSPFLSYSG